MALKYFTTQRNDTSGANDIERSIANYETRFGAIGATPPEPERENNLLLKALDILDRPRASVVGAIKSGLEGRNIGEGFRRGITGQEKATVADLLQKAGVESPLARGALGFVGDVLADPLTYLTLGTAGAAKGAATQGAKTFLKFAGKPLADITPATQAAEKALEASRLPELLGPAFSTKYIRKGAVTAEELPDIEKARDVILGAPRWARGQQQLALEDIQRRFKGVGKESAEEAAGIIEGKIAKTAEGKKAADIARQLSEETAAKDISYGIQFEKIPNYVRHLYKDPPEKVYAVLNKWQKEAAKLSPTGAFQKQRTIPTIEVAKKLGLNPIEDARILTAVREMEGIRLRAIEKMYSELKNLGENVVKEADKAPAGWARLPVKQLEGKAVHPEVARFLDRFNSVMETDEGVRTFGHILNNVQNVWKGLVTSPSPAFHIRNAIGNVFNNFLGGVVNPKFYTLAANIQRGRNEVVELAGKRYTGQQLWRMFQEQGLKGFGFFKGDSPLRYFKEAEEVFGSPGQKYSPIKMGRNVGDIIESNAKLAHFLDKLTKGYTPEQAAESVRKYLFDYGDLTKTEQKIKQFVPFFTWTRKNIPLQLEAMITQPGKFTALNKAIMNAKQATGFGEDDLPEWMKSEMAIPIRILPDGTRQALLLDLPLTNLNMLGKDTLKNALGMLTPLAKVPIELVQNKQIFSGAPVEKYPGAKARYGNIEMPAKLAYALSQLGAVPRSAADLVGVLQGQAPATGAIPSSPQNMPVFGTFLRNVNPTREEMLRAYDRLQQLADYRRYLEDVQGIPVPTIAELTSNKKPRRAGLPRLPSI
jgi:hypothetical protein